MGSILLQVLCVALGFLLLTKGADWFVDGAASIAAKFGIPSLVIGLTIVAMGTSAPEAAVSITSALQGSTGITVGNVVGSNILNTLVILGITSVITSVAVQRSTIRVELPFMFGITLVLCLFGYTGGSISFVEGLALWGLFVLYLLYLLRMTQKGRQDAVEEVDTDAAKAKPIWQLLGLTAVGAVCIVLGSNLTVEGACALARAFGISERFIGLTIVAFGTSLPELVTSVSAARKGEADIAVGNIVGSNIFNILFVVGTTALITPVTFAPAFITDTLIAAATAALLWFTVLRTHSLRRPWGLVMLATYATYFIVIS